MTSPMTKNFKSKYLILSKDTQKKYSKYSIRKYFYLEYLVYAFEYRKSISIFFVLNTFIQKCFTRLVDRAGRFSRDGRRSTFLVIFRERGPLNCVGGLNISFIGS